MTCWLTDKMSQIFFSTYPNWLVCLSVVESAFGTLWAKWYRSKGTEGEEPPGEMKKQIERYEAMQTAPTEEAIRLGKELCKSQAENLWAIGTAATAPMPVVASKKLGNVPETLPFYGNDWMFTCITRPETWFFKE
jgi:peptide/nickel transport system substrate-binding protein